MQLTTKFPDPLTSSRVTHQKPLQIAVVKGDVEIEEFLLDKGFDMNFLPLFRLKEAVSPFM